MSEVDRAKTRQLADAAHKARQWTELRDIRIRKAREEGQSLRTIAAVAGLSHTAIAKIVARG